jgi:hypothetical protein
MTAAINVKNKPTPFMWSGAVVLTDRRYLANEADGAITDERYRKIFVYDEPAGGGLKSESGATLQSNLFPEEE